jgi:uncharacterized membrane protein YdbT with pleckstrin-like domain
MGYAESLLARGEVVAVRGRQHILATLVDGRRAWAALIVAIAVLIIGTKLDGTAQTWVGYAGYVLLAIALVWLVIRYWDWMNQEYLVTNRRVIKVEGIVNKRSADSSLEKINDAVLDQNLFGRIFGYADLDILTAAEQAIDKFRMLSHALAFKRVMLEQKHELEMEVGRAPAYVPAPDGEGARGAAPRPAMSAAAGTGGPSPLVSSPSGEAERASTPEEITQTLDDLAGLRDRGAISPAEYEAKKAELLKRL